jgi:type I restriction enzyme R subunit
VAGSKEAQARIKINQRLQESAWRFFDDENGRANVALESGVKITQKEVDALGADFENTKNGFVDFLLLDDKDFPLVVLEAKREGSDPLDGKEQARTYAKSLNVRFVILSNGNLHYFWDLQRGNPAIISSFPTPGSLTHFQAFTPNPAKLAQEKIGSDYIVLTQNPGYANDPRWKDESSRPALVEDQGLKFLRDY